LRIVFLRHLWYKISYLDRRKTLDKNDMQTVFIPFRDQTRRMQRTFSMERSFKSRLRWTLISSLAMLAGLACSTPPEAEPMSVPISMAGARRRNREPAPHAATQPTTQPTHRAEAATSRPAPVTRLDAMAKPYRLKPDNIVFLVYELSPLVKASREEMVAAQHGLEEFRLDLSRLEPFSRFNTTSSRFPERRDAQGLMGEVVGGIEKETFEGAILRVEGGASASRFEFSETEEELAEVEKGSGALIRARLEVPFVGSRKRQQRVISQAFQESSARKAELGYVSNFRTYANQALNYYHYAIYNLDIVRAYDHKLNELNTLLNDPRVLPEDKPRIEAYITQAKVLHDQNDVDYRQYMLYMLTALGISMDDEYTLEEVPFESSRYARESRTPEGLQRMIEKAYRNNPTFSVLRDAIKDAELQRQQSIVGKYDLTAFVEGTQFPFGAETYDDRVGGWEIGGGLTVRLNDHRVLTASRLKAEAQIREFKAQIEAERLSIQQSVINATDNLRSKENLRTKVLELIVQRRNDYKDRLRRYLEDKDPSVMIDDVLYPLSNWTSAKVRLATNRLYCGTSTASLMAATGEVYRMVGMQVDNGQEDIFADSSLGE